MSLLDDVSIVVTPNGYKAGELYAVVPTYVEGAEEITNGDFATDSDWTKGTGVTISVGKAELLNTPTYSFSLNQATGLTVGLTYLVSYEIDDYISGQLRSRLGSNLGATISSDGVYEERIVAQSNSLIFQTIGVSFTGSIKNVSVKELTSADMDVTRATAATRVDENGLVNYAEVVSDTELITNGDFATDTDWSKGGGWSINGGIATHNGNSNSNIAQNIPLSVGTDYSVTYTVVNASAGSRIGISTNATSIQIERTTDGTYTETFTATLTSFYIRSLWNNGNPVSVDNVSVKKVDLDNVPRIDYTGGGCPHILAEPQRTNEIVNSDTSDFGIVRSARGVQETKLGIIEGYKYSYTSANPNINKNYSESTLGYKTLSVYFDATNSDYCQLNLASGGNGGAGANVLFTPSTQTFGSISENATYVRNSSANFESLGNNIYRIMLTTEFISYLGSTTFPIIYFGDNSNVWIGGVQVEQGSYATSYIPTSGSTVTRNQDQFSRDGIGSLINSTEGVLFVEMAALANDGTNKRISLSNGTNSYRIVISYSTSNNIQIFIVGAPAGTFAPSKSIDITLNSKIAVSWSSTEARFYVDGSPILVTLGNFSYTASTLSELKTEDGAGGSDFFGKVKQLQVYTTALTDTQLAALTS